MIQESDTRPLQYGAARQRLIRTLLQDPREPRTFYRLAKDSRVSYGWAHPVLRQLTEQGLIDAGRVVDASALFRTWAEMPPRAKSSDFQVQEPAKLFDDTNLAYAWTTYFAESLVQHQLFVRRLDFYAPLNDWNAWRKRLARDGLIGGGNVRVLLSDPHILDTSRTLRGRRVVCTPQLIVDLLREGGPCVQAAQMLMEKEYATH